MSINRREFLQTLAVASAGGLGLSSNFAIAQDSAKKFYELPKFGNVHLSISVLAHKKVKPHT